MDLTRQAASYRERRVLLAGDAAHMHSPIGGQGLNAGVQDAVNLGWKLAQVVNGTAPDSLLDTYHAERHPVGARVQQNTMAQTALTRSNARTDALRDTVAELVSMDEPRKRLAGSSPVWTSTTTSGHPLLGRRMPISTWSPPAARCGCSPCCTTSGPYYSTSVSPAASTSHRGWIGFS